MIKQDKSGCSCNLFYIKQCNPGALKYGCEECPRYTIVGPTQKKIILMFVVVV